MHVISFLHASYYSTFKDYLADANERTNRILYDYEGADTIGDLVREGGRGTAR